MTHVATKPEITEAPKEPHTNGRGVVALAERVERHHIQPLPDAHELVPDPFPPLLWHGLGWGALIGLLLGLLFAWLLLSSTLVIQNAEGLFSLVPFTFYTLWAMVGAAVGILLGGVGTILVAKPAPNPPVQQQR
ncbi:MAG: hypothetical protein DYG89_11345 [Caldilinea sp. CFX5]|nr:hypothetical protein [Caldilinea sp. CFX5]